MNTTINRRDFISIAVGAGAVALFPVNAVKGAQVSDKSTPPNILIIMADDLSAKDLSCYGSTTIATPNIDALAKNGIRFKTAWATPVCCPTRAEILTGRYGFRTGWRLNPKFTYECGDRPASMRIEDLNLTFANVLKCRGYDTWVGGKWMLQGINDNIVEQTQAFGFDEHCIWSIHGCYYPSDAGYTGTNEKTSQYWNPAFIKNGKHIPATINDFGPDINTDAAIEFMTRKRSRPFMMYYCTTLPHDPYIDVPDVNNPGGRITASLKTSIEYLDHLVGRLVKVLDDNGLRENTIIFFAGDNGSLGYGKYQITQEKGPRVPFIANCPGMVQGGRVSDELIDFSDVFPTLAELAGGSAILDGYLIDGHSFAPHLMGNAFTGREWIFSYYGDARLIRTKRFLLDGENKLWDCGNNRDEQGYTDVTNSTDPEVVAAKYRFAELLNTMPATGVITPPPRPTCQTPAVTNGIQKSSTVNSPIEAYFHGGKILLRTQQKGLVDIIDSAGRLLTTIPVHAGSVVRQRMQPGVYFVRFREDGMARVTIKSVTEF